MSKLMTDDERKLESDDGKVTMRVTMQRGKFVPHVIDVDRTDGETHNCAIVKAVVNIETAKDIIKRAMFCYNKYGYYPIYEHRKTVKLVHGRYQDLDKTYKLLENLSTVGYDEPLIDDSIVNESDECVPTVCVDPIWEQKQYWDVSCDDRFEYDMCIAFLHGLRIGQTLR